MSEPRVLAVPPEKRLAKARMLAGENQTLAEAHQRAYIAKVEAKKQARYQEAQEMFREEQAKAWSSWAR